MLCGHTHGGQLIPINHVGEWTGENCLRYGHERRLGTDFIVSSGISCWTIRFKTGCFSEYVVIDLKAAPDEQNKRQRQEGQIGIWRGEATGIRQQATGDGERDRRGR